MSVACQLYRLCVCACVCVCVCVCVHLCVCTRVWKFRFDFFPNTWYLIPQFSHPKNVSVWNFVWVCISTFLLAWESLFGANKLQFFRGLQWSWAEVGINYRIDCKLVSKYSEKRDREIERDSTTFSYIY